MNYRERLRAEASRLRRAREVREARADAWAEGFYVAVRRGPRPIRNPYRPEQVGR